MPASEDQQGLGPRITASTIVVIQDNPKQDLDHLDDIRHTLDTLILMMTHLYLHQAQARNSISLR